MEPLLETRPGIAIDRQSGKPRGGAVFEMEILTGGAFHATLTASNYQLWQLGLLQLVVDEMNNGEQKLGYAKSRGLGLVKVEPVNLVVEQFGPLAKGTDLKGIGAVPALAPYELVPQDTHPSGITGSGTLLGTRFDFEGAEARRVLTELSRGNSMRELLRTAVGR